MVPETRIFPSGWMTMPPAAERVGQRQKAGSASGSLLTTRPFAPNSPSRFPLASYRARAIREWGSGNADVAK